MEDDYIDIDSVRILLSDKFGDAVEITPCRSEGEFCALLSSGSILSAYRLIVMDVRLPWQLTGQDVGPVPPDVDAQGTERAGIRNCWRIARLQPHNCPDIILFTRFEPDDLMSELNRLEALQPIGVRVLRKDAIAELIEIVRTRLPGFNSQARSTSD